MITIEPKGPYDILESLARELLPQPAGFKIQKLKCAHHQGGQILDVRPPIENELDLRQSHLSMYEVWRWINAHSNCKDFGKQEPGFRSLV